MTVTIEKEIEVSFDFNEDEAIKAVVEAAAAYEKLPYEAEVSVTLTDNASIQEVNRDFRNTDAPTDVLSFPMADFETPADFDALEEMDDVFNPDTGEFMMGDIMIMFFIARMPASFRFRFALPNFSISKSSRTKLLTTRTLVTFS